MFFKLGVFKKFLKFHEKILVLESFFNKVAGQACNFIKKKTPTQVFSSEICEIFKSTVFHRASQVAVSEALLSWK